MFSIGSLFLRGAMWNMASFFIGQGIRFVTNVVLTRLLTPDLFGTMLIANTIRTGVELISDIGAGQNIVSSQNAEDPNFYNTVFTFQAVRGVILAGLMCAAALPLARFYNVPALLWIVPVTGIGSLFGGLTSPAREILRKKLRFPTLGIYEIAVSAVSSLFLVILAVIWPNIWSLVIGGVLSSFIWMAGSYFLRSGVHLRFHVEKKYSMEIIHYSKWIFLSSIAFFLSLNFDRLYLAKLIPLHMLGIYGIARGISDLIWLLVARLGANVLFPYVASAQTLSRAKLRQDLSPIRVRFLALCVLGVAVLAASSDLLIQVVYDRRYHEAMWMLPILVLGAWFSILTTVNEAVLLGLGKPSYGALSNLVKLVFLAASLPLGIGYFGLMGGVIVIAFGDLPKLVALQFGQQRERVSFAGQDAAMSGALLALVIAFELVRWRLGAGTSFDTLPVLTAAS